MASTSCADVQSLTISNCARLLASGTAWPPSEGGRTCFAVATRFVLLAAVLAGLDGILVGSLIIGLLATTCGLRMSPAVVQDQVRGCCSIVKRMAEPNKKASTMVTSSRHSISFDCLLRAEMA